MEQQRIGFEWHKQGRRITRRQWAAASAGVLAGCGWEPAIEHAQVSITRATRYDQRLYGSVREILAAHRLDVRGRNVLLKPNLVEFEPAGAINTHPLFVHAVYEAFRSMGAASVRIAEGPGHRRETLDMAEAAGIFQGGAGFRGSVHGSESRRCQPGPPEPAVLAPGEAISAQYRPGRRSAGLAAQNEDPSLGGGDALHEESFRRGSGRRLRLAEERAALGRHR